MSDPPEAAPDDDLSRLMREYQSGQIRAFEELYRLLAPRIQRFLYSKCFDRQLAEDLLQETFLQLHRARRTYSPQRPVLPWVYGIARNVLLMALRGRSNLEARKIDLELLDHEVASLSPDLGRVHAREIIDKVLQNLTPINREAVLMHHIFGFSFREIAGILGIRQTTAKVRAHRGMEDLREGIEKLSVTEPAGSAK
jgi:RNA polymerase sigma-70 factor (ECF subfamily)